MQCFTKHVIFREGRQSFRHITGELYEYILSLPGIVIFVLIMVSGIECPNTVCTVHNMMQCDSSKRRTDTSWGIRIPAGNLVEEAEKRQGLDCIGSITFRDFLNYSFLYKMENHHPCNSWEFL